MHKENTTSVNNADKKFRQYRLKWFFFSFFKYYLDSVRHPAGEITDIVISIIRK